MLKKYNSIPALTLVASSIFSGAGIAGEETETCGSKIYASEATAQRLGEHILNEAGCWAPNTNILFISKDDVAADDNGHDWHGYIYGDAAGYDGDYILNRTYDTKTVEASRSAEYKIKTESAVSAFINDTGFIPEYKLADIAINHAGEYSAIIESLTYGILLEEPSNLYITAYLPLDESYCVVILSNKYATGEEEISGVAGISPDFLPSIDINDADYLTNAHEIGGHCGQQDYATKKEIIDYYNETNHDFINKRTGQEKLADSISYEIYEEAVNKGHVLDPYLPEIDANARKIGTLTVSKNLFTAKTTDDFTMHGTNLHKHFSASASEPTALSKEQVNHIPLIINTIADIIIGDIVVERTQADIKKIVDLFKLADTDIFNIPEHKRLGIVDFINSIGSQKDQHINIDVLAMPKDKIDFFNNIDKEQEKNNYTKNLALAGITERLTKSSEQLQHYAVVKALENNLFDQLNEVLPNDLVTAIKQTVNEYLASVDKIASDINSNKIITSDLPINNFDFNQIITELLPLTMLKQNSQNKCDANNSNQSYGLYYNQ